MIRVEDQSGSGAQAPVKPKCPHCSQDLDTVYTMEMESQFGRRYLYYCPACRATLGVSHRKGFWMG